MLLLQYLGVRSAYLFAIFTCVQLVALVGNEVGVAAGHTGRISFNWAYGFTMTGFAILGVEGLTTVSAEIKLKGSADSRCLTYSHP